MRHGPVDRYPGAELRAWCAAILRGAGVAADDARLTAEVLVRTDSRGFPTHGLTRLRSYVEKLASGEVAGDARPEIRFNGAHAVIEAHGALGQVAGAFAVDEAVAATRERPLCVCTIRDCGHLGAVGMHVLRAAEAGRVAFILQATPPLIAMPGASGPMLGNSPFAIAAPRPGGPPVVVDMACSVAARGNILIAARAGEPIPDGWALDEHGEPTTDAEAALRGALLPFGGHKGLMMAVIVELLAGSLSGRPFDDCLNRGGQVRSASGHLNAMLLVFNPDLMAGRAAYEAHILAWTAHYAGMGGPDARIPGERAAAAEADAARHGVPIASSIAADLERLGREHGMPFAAPTAVGAASALPLRKHPSSEPIGRSARSPSEQGEAMPRAIVLHPGDNVATLIDSGRSADRVQLTGERSETLDLRADVPYGHKCAIGAIPRGAEIIKYGEVIGRATADIAAGDHVHVHNVEALRGRGDIQERR